jgi:hypothetical protein
VTTSPQRKEPPIPTEWEAGWPSQPDWGFNKKKLMLPPGIKPWIILPTTQPLYYDPSYFTLNALYSSSTERSHTDPSGAQNLNNASAKIKEYLEQIGRKATWQPLSAARLFPALNTQITVKCSIIIHSSSE